MNMIRLVLKRNIVPIIFFLGIMLGTASFVDYRNNQIERVRELIIQHRNYRALLQSQAQNIESLSLGSSGSKSEYESIIKEFEVLQGILKEAQSKTAEQPVSSSEEYLDYIEGLDIFYNTYLESMERVKNLLEQKRKLTADIDIFLSGADVVESNINSFIRVADYLKAASSDTSQDSNVTIIKSKLQKINSDNVITADEALEFREVMNNNPIFIPEGDYLIYLADIENIPVFEAYEDSKNAEISLRSIYSLEELD